MSRWVLVDGYSVLHAWPQLARSAGRSLEKRRAALLEIMAQYADQSGRRLTVVFDGYNAKHKPESATHPSGLEVIFSPKGKTADEVIERAVAQAPGRANILVVTSDGVERQIVQTLGASCLSAEAFAVEVQDALRDLARLVRQHGRAEQWGKLRDRCGGMS